MNLQPLGIFIRQHWLFLLLFQLALAFIIPRAETGQYLFVFLFIKGIQYGTLITHARFFHPGKLYIYMNLGTSFNRLLATTCIGDSILSIILILVIQ